MREVQKRTDLVSEWPKNMHDQKMVNRDAELKDTGVIASEILQ